MDINSKMQQMNNFSGGMNSDTSDAYLKSDSYRLAQNLRYITNNEENSGEMHIIEGGLEKFRFDEDVVAMGDIRDYGVAITKDLNGYFSIWRIDHNSDDETPIRIFGPCSETLANNYTDKISINLNYEASDNIKLYIADGQHPIMLINIAEENEEVPTNFDYISSHPRCLLETPIFCGLTSGTLEGGVYQYAYRLYNKYKQASELSPVTKLIPLHTGPVMFTEGKNINGCEEGKPSGKGVQLKLQIPDSSFDRYLVYRIKYIENGQVPTVELIADSKIYDTDEVIFIDNGQSALDTLTLEEFNSVSGIHIIPKVIESKEGWMFASNIKTDNVLDSDPNVKEWDARAYRYDPEGNTKIYDYSNRSDVIEFSLEQLKNGKIDVPEEFDCYNPFNDINEDFPDFVGYWYAPCIENSSDLVYGGAGKHITWNFITTHVTGDSCISGEDDTYYGDAGTAYNYISLNSNTTQKQFKKWYIYGKSSTHTSTFERESWNNTVNNNDTYANPVISYEFKSLRRNELYRFGIIFYNDKGETSSVKWIADIRTPKISECTTFVSHYGPEGKDKQYDLSTRPLGIEFKVENLPDGVVGYEIVRCSRGYGDIATVSQGVLNKPSIQYKRQSDYKTNLPLMATGWITTGGLHNSRMAGSRIFNVDPAWQSDYPLAYDWQAFNYNIKGFVEHTNNNNVTVNNSEYLTQTNNDTFEFISPEVNYQNQSIRDTLTSSTKIHPEMFLFGCAYNNGGTDAEDYRHKYSTDHLFATSHEQTGVYVTWIPYDRLIFPGPKYTTLCSGRGSYDENQTTSDTGSEKGLYIDDPYYTIPPNDNVISTFARVVQIPNMFIYSLLYSERPIPTVNKDYNIDQDYYSNHYSYIKLYEQSQDVITKKNDYSLLYCNHGSDRNNGTQAESVDYLNLRSSNNKSFNIKDLTYNTTHSWDGFATYDSEHDSDTFSYTDYLSPIGDKNHLDWIVSSLYGIKIKEGYDLDDDQEDAAWTLGGLIGPSDRCALIQLDNKNGNLMQTVAAFTRKRKDRYGYIRDENAPDSPVSGTTLDRVCIPDPNVFQSNPPIGTFVNVFRESMFGTYLCNVRHDVIPYGGYTYQDRCLNTYSSYGDFVIRSGESNVSQVFDGDCYIQPFEYMSMHRGYYHRLKYYRNHTIVYSIPVETNINLAYTYGSEFSKVKNVNLQVDATNVNNVFVQQDDMYVYNSVYSQNSASRLHASMITDEDVDINVYDYRTYYSDTKINNEYIDSWLKYRSSNYLDVDTRFGAISGLRLFHNQLVYWQEEATGVFSVNERALVDNAIETNAPLQLGTGGTLARYDYLATSNGMRLDELCDTQSDTTLYWWDHDKAEICAYAGERTVVSLSKIKNVQNFINDRKIEQRLSECPYLTFDKKYSELIANVTDGTAENAGSLVYSEVTQQFVGLYNIHPTYGMRFSDSLYMSDNSIVGRWNTFKDYASSWLDASLTPYLKYPVNNSFQEVKVFDNMRIGGRLYQHEKSNLRDTDYLSKIKFTFSTPLKQKSSCNGSSLTNAEYDYRLAIPRNNNDAFGGRMRGKTMETEISSTSNSMDFSLQYVITKYRISWS